MAGCPAAAPPPPPGAPAPPAETVAGKIDFAIADFDAHGLRGPPTGRRAVAYEFCIPAGGGAAREVAAIDRSARLYPGTPGRIGCGGEAVLVIGSTHQPGFRAVLARLAALPYVTRITEAVFE